MAKRSIFEHAVRPGANRAVRELECELDEVESKAVAELSAASTRIRGKIRLQLVKESRITLRLIGFTIGPVERV